MKRERTIPFAIAAAVFILACAVLYMFSHGTYYKYNDWAIVGKHINNVCKLYGEFDINEPRYAAYYIYTDKSDFHSGHIDHYYYMEIDEYGIVTRVYDGCQPAG